MVRFLYYHYLWCGFCIITICGAVSVSSLFVVRFLYHHYLWCGFCIITICGAVSVSSLFVVRFLYHHYLWCGFCIIPNVTLGNPGEETPACIRKKCKQRYPCPGSTQPQSTRRPVKWCHQQHCVGRRVRVVCLHCNLLAKKFGMTIPVCTC